MFWTPLGIVGTSLGPDLGFGVVYFRILWDLFGISVGHVGTCWDMFEDFSDLDQKSMTKHSRSQIPTVGIRESANVGFRIPHSGELGTRILGVPLRNPHSGELGSGYVVFPNPHSGDSGSGTHVFVFCPTGTQSWLGAILLSFDLVYKNAFAGDCLLRTGS